MLITFLSHQWKGFWRSKSKGGTIAANILIGFFTLYMLTLAIGLGFYLEFFIGKFSPGKDVGVIFNGIIIYYFAIDFILRLQLQELPTMSIVPYLHLRIPKGKIVRFLNVRALFNAFNILPLFLFIPFCCTYISDVHGTYASLMFCVSILSLIVFNNYTALYVKRLTLASTKYVVITVVVISVLAALEYYKIFSIKAISNGIFGLISKQPALALGFTVMAILMFIINAKYLRKNLYTEELGSSEEKKTSTDYPLLNRFGEAGTLVALELKLILRHKRTRTALMMSLLFIFYGFLFYKEDVLKKDALGMVIFAATFMTGSAVTIYGQFMFGWQGSYFDGLLANKTNFRNFIKAKFLLFTIMSTITTCIITFYGFLSWKILAVQFATYLYNIGLGTVVILYFATRNYKAIDLSKGSTFNYQGVSASQFVLMIPYFALPYLFYQPFASAGKPYYGLICLGFFGLAGLLTRSYWIAFILKEFNKRKYKIAEGFRQTP
ncbi:DUF5687 family protein [Pedobacter frigoris]|uniref:DUF5687 family protein n=1 Tax=Pedobacter frigoris TaxID=2571272 RepID=UPI00292D268B|nr:DUF5687 family protein [Pedobacter frigoris]